MTDAEQLAILDSVYQRHHVTDRNVQSGRVRLMANIGWINTNGMIKPYGCTLTEAGERRYRELLNAAGDGIAA